MQTSKLGLPLVCSLIAALATLGAEAVRAQEVAPENGPNRSAEAPRDTDDDASTDVLLEEIVVTGTSRKRLAFGNPMSVTQMTADELSIYSFNSQADILRQVPGIRAEGGGGEVAANVFIRGMPSGGQFQFTPLEYDGLPAFSTFGLNSSAFDVYYRNDLGIERMEFVRGGVSNLFGPGSVAGIINYISKTGSDIPEGAFQLQLGETTEGPSANIYRADLAISGPLNRDAQLYYALSGYYRYDEGPLNTGLPTQGGQIRANIKKEFDDGSGSFTLLGQAIDDRIQFFLPFPLDGASRGRALGNDGEEVFTVQTDEAQFLNFPTPGGRFETPIRDGVATSGGSIGLVLEKELRNDWMVSARAKYASYDHQFNLFLDGDGVVNVPETQAGFLEARGLPSADNAEFTFTRSGQPLPEDFLLFPNRLLDRDRPATDFTLQADLVKSFAIASVDHQVTLGTFFARAEADDQNTVTTYLAEFNNRPRLVDLVVTDTTGAETVISQNGLLDAGTSFTNVKRTATRYAGYLADQMEAGDFAFDIGVRVERLTGELLDEITGPSVVRDDPALSADLQSVVHGTGDFHLGEVGETAWAASAGALYRFTDTLNVYGNFARGFFFPQLRGIAFDPQGNPSQYEAEIIKQAEVGLKYQTPELSATVTGYWVELSNRQDIRFVNAPGGGVINVANLVGTRTLGIEATAAYSFSDNLSIQGNVTLQDHEFTDFDGAPEFIGHEMPRQPKSFVNAGIFYDDGRFDVAVFNTFQGRTFSSNANNIELDEFHLARLEAGYTFEAADGQFVRVSLSVFNLFDSDGVTEGSPRVGEAQSSAGEFFVGRPILPRRVSLTVRYTF